MHHNNVAEMSLETKDSVAVIMFKAENRVVLYNDHV